ncbi:hypothetical protein [Paenibacillus sp. NPDC058071]|uniref:hypothetical protein n=1 Tax=Paenibacillus sp. NPDC058071 TaxID=3346326 RepID=UPI0036DB78E9
MENKEQAKKRDLTISGIASTRGGSFNRVKIDGIGRVEGDIECSAFSSNGKMTVNGSVRTKITDMNGIGSLKGGLYTEKLDINGKVNVGGDLVSEELHLSGMLTVQGDCEAESFQAEGRLAFGSLNAGHISIKLQGPSRINEIGGETIQIRKHSGKFAKLLKALPLPAVNRLTAGVIEGDEIYLENTKADIVRGSQVTIGEGCEIGRVEYKTNCHQHKDAIVGNREQL